MAKFIHNVSGSTVTYLGVPITSGSFFQIPLVLERKYASDDSLLADISSGAVFMSKDGSTDIDEGLSRQIDFLKAVDGFETTLVDDSGNAVSIVQGPQGESGADGAAGAAGFGIYAFANTASNGTLRKVRGLTLSKGGTGVYDYSFTTPTPDTFYNPVVNFENLGTNTDTNYFINNKTVNGFRITMGIGDNGTAPDTLADFDHGLSVLGEAGPQGITSAYEAWLSLGNIGTEADFIATLVGPQGPQGIQGPQGPAGSGLLQVSPNDTTVGFLEDKFVAADDKVSVLVINDGADEDIEISVNPGNIGTSELNNDANFINSSQAPVQPIDIIDFETTTQLNTRDANNRNRGAHTGTQLASTISDFTSAVQAAESVTSLSFNAGTNILSFVDEAGSTTNLDLSLFLDDTNLSRISSGVLNSANGICTFTRDDNSTFDVDFSSLNDQGAINTAIAAHDASINNHDDVNFNSLQNGDIAVYMAGSWMNIPGSTLVTFKDFASTNIPAGSQITSFQQYLRLTTTVPLSGYYKISWDATWSLNSTNSDFVAQIELDDNTILDEFVREAKDSAGAGIVVNNLAGGTFNSGTNQRYKYGGHSIVLLSDGSHTIDMDVACSLANTEAVFYRGVISIERWN